jgi:hypothetical protein
MRYLPPSNEGLATKGAFAMRVIRSLLFIACLLTITPHSVLPSQERASEEARPAAASPFSNGERLVFRIKWDPPWYLFFLPSMEAGEAEVQLIGDAQYKNKKAVNIILTGRSSGTLMKMSGMKIEDEYAFFAEPETFCAMGASEKIREGKRKRQIEVEYLRETNQLHIREMDESVVPPKLKKDEIKNNIPSCVKDPLSALYFYRQSELRPDQEQLFVLGYNDRIKEVKTHVEKQEIVETPAGKFNAWSIKTSALMGGLFKDGGQFRIWLSADQRKIPLQFEVKVSLGKVLGKLKSLNPQNQ